MEWISIEDKMPDNSQWVLCWSEPCKTITSCIYDSERIWFEEQYTGDPLAYITHWMPLPEPPKQ